MTANLPKKIVIASRGSKLALWQAHYVSGLLQSRGFETEVRTWKTTGDIVQDRYLHEIGGKGLFTKELEEAMLRGEAHLAVHSLKDLPCHLPKPFVLATILPRHSSGDTLIFKKDLYQRLGLQAKAVITPTLLNTLGPLTIATSSLRRQSLLKSACKDVTVVPVRGNVDTRLQKLENEPSWHGIILATASLERLQIKDLAAHGLDSSWFVPCPGQGALALEAPEDSELLPFLKELDCPSTRLAITVERRVLARLGGDCTLPFGCHISKDSRSKDQLLGRAVVLSANGESASACKSMPLATSNLEAEFERLLVQELSKNGANSILQSLGMKFPI